MLVVTREKVETGVTNTPPWMLTLTTARRLGTSTGVFFVQSNILVELWTSSIKICILHLSNINQQQKYSFDNSTYVSFQEAVAHVYIIVPLFMFSHEINKWLLRWALTFSRFFFNVLPHVYTTKLLLFFQVTLVWPKGVFFLCEQVLTWHKMSAVRTKWVNCSRPTQRNWNQIKRIWIINSGRSFDMVQ